MVIAKGNIGNALHSVAPEHVVATAFEVYDEEYKLSTSGTVGAYQEEINKELFSSSVSSSDALSQSLHQVSASITARIDAESAGSSKLPVYVVSGSPTAISSLEGIPVTASRLQVTGNGQVDGTLKVTGLTTLGEVTASNVQVTGNEKIAGNEEITGTLKVTGGTTASNISASGHVSASNVRVTGNESVGGTLGVTGNTSLTTVTASSNARVKGNLAVEGSEEVGTNLQVAGNAAVTGTLDVNGLSTLGNVTASNVRVTGNESVGGTLGVTGLTTLANTTASNVQVTGNEKVAGTLGVSGLTTLANTTASNVQVTGNQKIAGTLGVTGLTTLVEVTASNVQVTGNEKIAGNAEVTGALKVVGNTTATNISASGYVSASGVQVNGNEKVTGNVEVGGTLKVTGLSTLGNVTASKVSASTLIGTLQGTASHASQVPWSGSFIISKSFGTQSAQNIIWSENSNSLKTFNLIVPGTASHIGALANDTWITESASINTRITNAMASASDGVTEYSNSVAATINKVRATSGSWDAAKDWTGANSGNLATFTSSLKTLTISKGAVTTVTDQAYNPTGSNVTIQVPTTASHLGAVATDQTASMTAGTASRLSPSYDAGSTSKPVYFTGGRPSAVSSVEGIPVTASVLRSNGDATIAGNLVVEGTASFRNRHDLVVGDTLILLASGANSRDTANGGGIAVQTASATTVEAAEKNAARIQYDATNDRFTASVAFAAPTFTGNLTGTASHVDTSLSGNGNSITMSVGNETKTLNINNPTNAVSASHANFSQLVVTNNKLTASIGNQTRTVDLTGVSTDTPFTVLEQKSYYLTASVGTTTRSCSINSASYAAHADNATSASRAVSASRADSTPYSHTHSNKTILDGISGTVTQSWNSKWDYNEATIKAVKVNSASEADHAISASRADSTPYSHTHSNKALLDSLTNTKTGSWDAKWNYNEATIKAVKVNSASEADHAISASRAVSAASADAATVATGLGVAGNTSASVASAIEAKWTYNESTIKAVKVNSASEADHAISASRAVSAASADSATSASRAVSAASADTATSASRAVSAASADSATSASRAVSAASADYTTRLHRRDDSSNYSVQTHWDGTYWVLQGYSGDTYHAGCYVARAGSAATATSASYASYASSAGSAASATSASRAVSAASADSATSASRAVSAASADSATDSTKLPLAGGTMSGIIYRDNGGSWISGRDHAIIRTSRTSSAGSDWHPAVAVKTSVGCWTFGSVGGETLCLSYDTDANYSINNNDSAVINFPDAGKSGTLALTSDTVARATSASRADSTPYSHTHGNKAILDTWTTQELVSSPSASAKGTSGEITLDSGKFNVCGTLAGTVTFKYGSAIGGGRQDIYAGQFKMGSTVYTINWPSGITWIEGSPNTSKANCTYEFSICNGVGILVRT